MRHLAQLFYFLGSLPGLGILSRVGSKLSRLSAFSTSVKAAKVSLSKVRGKDEVAKKDDDTEESEDSK